jgi:hypothetical protein
MLSPRFEGILVTEGNGTAIKGKFEMTTFEKLSATLFFIGALVASSHELYMINSEGTSGHVGKFLGCLALLPFLILVVHLGWRIRRDDIDAIKNMLKDALDSRISTIDK